MAYTYNGGQTGYQSIYIVPPTTELALVFPFDQDNKKFDKGFYSSALTNGRASCDQIERFLSEVEDAFKDKLKWLRWFKAYLVYSSVVGMTTLLLFTFAVVSDFDDGPSSTYQYNDHSARHNIGNSPYGTERSNFRHQHKTTYHDSEEDVINLSIAWFGAIISCLFWSLVFALVKKYSYKKARSGVQAVIDKNQPLFMSVGLRWNLPLAFPHYIELWKDYKGQDDSQRNAQNMRNYNYVENIQACNHQHQAQAQNQISNTAQPQKYPNLNQVVDPQAYFNFQNNQVTNQTPLYHGQRNDNNYVPPYAVNL